MSTIKKIFKFIGDSFKYVFIGVFKIIGKILGFFLKPIFAPKNARSKARVGVIFTLILSIAAFFFIAPQIFNKAADKLNNGKDDFANSEKLIFKSSGFDQWLNSWQFPYFYTKKFTLGLDLRGGTHLTYLADLSKIESKDYVSAMDGVRDTIERRVNLYGVSEPVVQTSKVGNEYRVIVDLADVKDTNEAIKMIGETPLLEFKEEKTEEEINQEKAETKKQRNEETKETVGVGGLPAEALAKEGVNPPSNESESVTEVKATDASGNPVDVNMEQNSDIFVDPFKNTGLSGKQLKRADVVFDPNTYTPQVSIEFNDEGRDLFAEITKRSTGKRIAIYLDGFPISAPVVNDPILDGKAVIQGQFTADGAKELAQRLNEGALPVPIKLIGQQNIGASLGDASLSKSLKAGIIGFLVVIVFMFFYYRLPGLLADFALIVYALISLAIFKLIPVTLTLPGIAGFILSIGMAVNANVLIFERIKEELQDGRRSLETCVSEGFSLAWPSIRDGNVSTLISCVILYTFASSSIKGFALTLIVGILTSMLSAIIITKLFIKYSLLSKATGWLGKYKWLWKCGIK